MTVDELFPVDGKYTLGSLFDGAGGFPLAAQMCGIKPVWASEIEPFPIAVTKARFPNMKHLGDVTKINGAEIEPVDIISFGSPCQNLSVAGNGKGLSGEQSGLFLEAIRIIKEMREATNGKKPRMAIWENVMGAFNTNGGVTSGKSSPNSAISNNPQHTSNSQSLNGHIAVVSWETDLASLGEASTLNIGESPSVAVESSLWQVLMTSVPPKYSLSAKACAGILRRSEMRGKPLPEILRAVLTARVAKEPLDSTPN